MNIEGINLEEIDNLSREEKRELVRKLIHSEAADIGVSAAFFNSKTKESMDMKGLVERVGEEDLADVDVSEDGWISPKSTGTVRIIATANGGRQDSVQINFYSSNINEHSSSLYL